MPDNHPESNIPYRDWKKGVPYKKFDVVRLENILDSVSFFEWTKDPINPNYKMVNLQRWILMNNVSRKDFLVDQITTEFDSYDLGSVTKTTSVTEDGEKFISATSSVNPNAAVNASKMSNNEIKAKLKITNNSNWPVQIRKYRISWSPEPLLSIFNHGFSGLTGNGKAFNIDYIKFNPNNDILENSASAQDFTDIVFQPDPSDSDSVGSKIYNEMLKGEVEYKGEMVFEVFQPFLELLGFNASKEIRVPIKGRLIGEKDIALEKRETYQYILIQNFNQDYSPNTTPQLGYKPGEHRAFGNSAAEVLKSWSFENFKGPISTDIINYLPKNKSAHDIETESQTAEPRPKISNNHNFQYNKYREGKFINCRDIASDPTEKVEDVKDNWLLDNIELVANKFLSESRLNQLSNFQQWSYLKLHGDNYNPKTSDVFEYTAGWDPNETDLTVQAKGVNYPSKNIIWDEDFSVAHAPYSNEVFHQGSEKTLQFNNVFGLQGFTDSYLKGKAFVERQHGSTSLPSPAATSRWVSENGFDHYKYLLHPPTMSPARSDGVKPKWPKELKLHSKDTANAYDVNGNLIRNMPTFSKFNILPNQEEYENTSSEVFPYKFAHNVTSFHQGNVHNTNIFGSTPIFHGKPNGPYQYSPLYYQGEMGDKVEYGGRPSMFREEIVVPQGGMGGAWRVVQCEYMVAFNFICQDEQRNNAPYIPLQIPSIAISVAFSTPSIPYKSPK